MSAAKFIDWAEAMDAAGKHDAMGHPFTSWQVVVRDDTGKVMRDAHYHPVYETQANFKARLQLCPVPTGQTLSLF